MRLGGGGRVVLLTTRAGLGARDSSIHTDSGPFQGAAEGCRACLGAWGHASGGSPSTPPTMMWLCRPFPATAVVGCMEAFSDLWHTDSSIAGQHVDDEAILLFPDIHDKVWTESLSAQTDNPERVRGSLCRSMTRAGRPLSALRITDIDDSLEASPASASDTLSSAAAVARAPEPGTGTGLPAPLPGCVFDAPHLDEQVADGFRRRDKAAVRSVFDAHKSESGLLLKDAFPAACNDLGLRLSATVSLPGQRVARGASRLLGIAVVVRMVTCFLSRLML